MADNEHRIRVVLLGGASVGKSSIIHRFLYNKYTDKYKSTVEDLYNRDYDIGNITLKVDILDTSGDFQFPAMRRLCIANAHAFLLVYSVAQSQSFDIVRQCIREIKDLRSDHDEVPMVIAANKMDLEIEREVFKEDVSEWIYKDLSGLRCRLIECSAKDNLHIKDIFRTFLQIGRLPTTKDESSAFRRQASAYSKTRPVRKNSPKEVIPEASSGSTPSSPSLFSRNKPRSRSLIRRSSRKAKQQVRESQADDCSIC